MKNRFTSIAMKVLALMMLASSSFAMAKFSLAIEKLQKEKPSDRELIEEMELSKGDKLLYIDSYHRLQTFEVFGLGVQNEKVITTCLKLLGAKEIRQMAVAKNCENFKIGQMVYNGSDRVGILLGFYYNGDALIDTKAYKRNYKRLKKIYPIIEK